jgi:hypothetical protein
MNKVLTVFFLMLALGSSKAQTTVAIHSSEHYGKDGYNYKDSDNRFNLFEGSWKFTSGSTSLEIRFSKKQNMISQESNVNYSFDALVGEYKYVENGSLKINTLQNLNIDTNNAYDYNLVATHYRKYGDLTCNNCGPGNTYVEARYVQPNCNHGSVPIMSFRHFTENGVHKLQMFFMANTRIPYDPDTLEELTCDTFAIPYGEYILVKQ